MVVAEFSVTPITDQEMRPYVDAAVEEIRKSGLKHEVEAMGTTIEGEIDKILDVVKNAHQAVKSMGVERVITELKIDDKIEGATIEQEVKGYRASL